MKPKRAVMTRELRHLCEQVRQLVEKMRKHLARQAPDTAPKLVALYMFAKAYRSYQAAMLLYHQGFWQDAASIGRTVLELDFQARWLDKDPQTASKLFLRGVELDHVRVMKNLKLAGDEKTRVQAEALLKELERSNDVNKSWNHWWAKESSVRKLAAQIGCDRLYFLQYHTLSWFVHSVPVTIRYYLTDERTPSPDCSPSLPNKRDHGFAQTLLSAAPGALMAVLAVVDNIFDLKLQADFDRVGHAFQNFNEARVPAEASAESK